MRVLVSLNQLFPLSKQRIWVPVSSFTQLSCKSIFRFSWTQNWTLQTAYKIFTNQWQIAPSTELSLRPNSDLSESAANSLLHWPSVGTSGNWARRSFKTWSLAFPADQLMHLHPNVHRLELSHRHPQFVWTSKKPKMRIYHWRRIKHCQRHNGPRVLTL